MKQLIKGCFLIMMITIVCSYQIFPRPIDTGRLFHFGYYNRTGPFVGHFRAKWEAKNAWRTSTTTSTTTTTTEATVP